MATFMQKAMILIIVSMLLLSILYSKAYVMNPTAVLDYAQDKMNNFEDILSNAGIFGPIYVFIFYFITTVFMLPLWGFHISTRYVYVNIWSSLLISVTQALCSCAAFTASRYCVGPYIRNRLERHYGNKYLAIDRAVREDGFRIILLLRLSPIIPFGINNYLCGCTDMKLWQFGLGTWLGVLPGTTAYCNLGAMGKTVLAEGTTMLQKISMMIGIIAAIAVIKILSNLASNALKEAGIDAKKQ